LALWSTSYVDAQTPNQHGSASSGRSRKYLNRRGCRMLTKIPAPGLLSMEPTLQIMQQRKIRKVVPQGTWRHTLVSGRSMSVPLVLRSVRPAPVS
jgi:hypothetical protein